MKSKFAYSVLVKINNHSIPEDDEFGAEFDMDIEFCQQIVHPKSNGYMDQFACEYDHVRFDTVEHWIEDLAKVKSGFYELRYNYNLSPESWETPHIMEVEMEDFELVPSRRAMIGYYKQKICDLWYNITERY